LCHECQWQWNNAITNRCRDFNLSHNLQFFSAGKVALFEAWPLRSVKCSPVSNVSSWCDF
jgi:hypothetical protein